MSKASSLFFGIVFVFGQVSAIMAQIETNYTQETPPVAFSMEGLEIGHAHYRQSETGVTVFYFPKRVKAAVDLRGGAIGSFFTGEDLQNGYGQLDSIVFTGGSILGLEAISGVMEGIFEKRNYQTSMDAMPLVSGACIYDFGVRLDRNYPDKRLGLTAFKARQPGIFFSGPFGVGKGASVGKLKGLQYHQRSGQGAAFFQQGKIKVAVFTVVNSFGVILDPEGKIMKGAFDSKAKTHLSLPKLNNKDVLKTPKLDSNRIGNTTLSLVVTNVDLTPFQLKALGKQVQNGISQFIQPYGTSYDGDVLYTVSTGAVKPNWEDRREVKLVELGIIAKELLQEAVYSVFVPEDSGTNTLSSKRPLFRDPS